MVEPDTAVASRRDSETEIRRSENFYRSESMKRNSMLLQDSRSRQHFYTTDASRRRTKATHPVIFHSLDDGSHVRKGMYTVDKRNGCGSVQWREVDHGTFADILL